MLSALIVGVWSMTEAEKLLNLDGGVIDDKDMHEPEEVDPWKISQAHGMVETIVRGSRKGDIDHVIEQTAHTCDTRVPHLCLGQKKSDILAETIKEAVKIFEGSLNVLEMGSHLGDGTLYLMRHLPPGSNVISIEYNPMELSEGHKLIKHATYETGINYIPMLLDRDAPFEDFMNTLKKEHNIHELHTVMFDQAPKSFGPDLETLRKKNMLKTNSHIIADNMYRHGKKVNDYVNAVKKKPFETKFHNIPEPYWDQMAVSVYNKKHDEL